MCACIYLCVCVCDCLEMHVEAVQPGERALIIDDLVATGGTLSAATTLPKFS